MYITCRCSVFLKFVNEGIVNIQVLCSIPLVWTWRYCQWYWQCLHMQTKGALITCINYCHLLVLTLLCLVDLWKLDESISNFKGVWCIYFYFISYRNACMQTVKTLIIRRASWSQDDIHKTRASHTDLKPRFVLFVHSCILYAGAQCSLSL